MRQPVSIPAWTPEGLLPPIDMDYPASRARAPYPVSLTDFVWRFGAGSARQNILLGFLDYRAALHKAGLKDGFQWVNGSFLEYIETIEQRDPNDIDVVTFYWLPDGQDQRQILTASPEVFNRTKAKQKYCVDPYFMQLNGQDPETLIDTSVYWYSMWSHRRDFRWKGYLQLDLHDSDEEAVRAMLTQSMNEGGRQ